LQESGRRKAAWASRQGHTGGFVRNDHPPAIPLPRSEAFSRRRSGGAALRRAGAASGNVHRRPAPGHLWKLDDHRSSVVQHRVGCGWFSQADGRRCPGDSRLKIACRSSSPTIGTGVEPAGKPTGPHDRRRHRRCHSERLIRRHPGPQSPGVPLRSDPRRRVAPTAARRRMSERRARPGGLARQVARRPGNSPPDGRVLSSPANKIARSTLGAGGSTA
jgi:hypothetical protein